MRAFCVCVLACAAAVSAPAATQSLSEVVSGIELRYNRLATMQSEFSQSLSVGGRLRAEESGTVKLLRPQKMRWDYSKPKGRLLVGDGELLRMYHPYTNQVRTVRLSESADMRAPLSFLLGRMRLERQFRNLRLETIEGKTVLVGEGRTGREAYGRVEFHYDPTDFRLYRLRVSGRDDSLTEFEFSHEELNPRLDPSLFVFEAPPGAEILPETDLGAER